MTLTLEINGNIITNIINVDVRQVITRRASEFQAEIYENTSLESIVVYLADVKITVNSTVIFRGRIENIKRKNKILKISGRDYFSIFFERYANETYTAQTASQILSDLITNYASELTTAITTTTTTYDKEYRNVPISQIIEEFCNAENFQAYVDCNKVFYFEPQGYTDTGKVFDYDTGEGGIVSHDFAKIGKKVKNVITVYGAPGDPDTAGICVQKRDPESVKQYGIKALVISDPSLTTEDDAYARAVAELARYSRILETGTITVIGDETLSAGQTVYLSIDELGYDLKKFLVVAVEHIYPSFTTKLTLADLSLDVADLLKEFIKKIKLTDATQSDYSATLKRYETFEEEITISASYEVYQYIVSGTAVYNQGTYNSSPYGPQTQTLTLIRSGNMVVTNDGLNAIRNFLAGDTVVSPSYIAVGTGTTTATASDTVLELETSREAMDAGYPSKPANFQVTYQRDISTAEENGNSLSEIGLFNDAVAGTMFCRTTFDPIAKNSTFGLKMRITLTISSG